MATSTQEFLLFCIFAVNITELQNRRARAAKYRLSFTKIKYSEQQEGEENPLVESNFVVSVIRRCSIAISTLPRRFDVIQLFLNNNKSRPPENQVAHRFPLLKIFRGLNPKSKNARLVA